MHIPIVSAVGHGNTTLAAFDAALLAAGIGNFNLLTLSSVIPAGATIITDGAHSPPSGSWGDRLYVVMAQQRTEVTGAEVWAAIGWVQDDSGRGLFVEHEGPSEQYVREQVNLSLEGLVRNRPESFGDQHTIVAGATHEGEPVCALVAAVYQAAPW